MNIEKLKENFVGVGEVQGFTFNQIARNENAALFDVQCSKSRHFEVFMIKHTPKCIDFEKRLYSETEFREVYPKAREFGYTAFTFKDYVKSITKFNDINLNKIK